MKRQAGGVSAANKRKKEAAKLSNPLTATLLATSGEERKLLAQGFSSAVPFPHVVLKPLYPHKRLEEVFTECTHNLQAELKDTDMCRVFQTCKLEDLESLSETSADGGGEGKAIADVSKLRGLMALRDALYSKEMRTLVEEVAGCGSLSETRDCTIDIFNQGCFRVCGMERSGAELGARVVGFEAYLSSPDEEWTGDDGGVLQMFASDSGDKPVDKASAEVAPLWNTMLLFKVGQQSPSYSAVEEILSDKTRMCISGYYHSEQEVSEMPQAAANKNGGAEDEIPFDTKPYEGFPEEPSVELPEKDLEYLSKYINPEYLKAENIAKIREKFEDDSSTMLSSFLLEDVASTISTECIQADENDKLGNNRKPLSSDVGLGNGWSVQGPPNERRYVAMVDGGADVKGKSLKKISSEVLMSGSFGRLLGCITGLRVLGGKSQVRRFRAGLDYACASGMPTDDYYLDAVLSFVDDQGPIAGEEEKGAGGPDGKEAGERGDREAEYAGDGGSEDQDATKADIWESGAVGGYLCYVEGEDPPPVGGYSSMSSGGAGEDEEAEAGPLFKCTPQNNALCIALRDAGTLNFVKYVSCSAPGSRWDASATYSVDGVDADDEGNGGAAK